MRFFPYAPIELGKNSDSLVDGDRSVIATFWDEVDERLDEGLSEAVGCYIFSIRAGRRILPWYVGAATKQPFRKECFSARNVNLYNEALTGRKGTPEITFLAKRTDSGRWPKPGSADHEDISFLEAMLIGRCIRRNPKLLNIKATKLLKGMDVPGLVSSSDSPGRPYKSVSDFRDLIGA